MDELERLVNERTEHMRWRKDFAQWRAARLRAERIEEGKAEEMDALLPPGNVLELGCGMGGLAVALAKRGRKVVAVDYNEANCRIARLRARKSRVAVRVVRAAGEALPFKDGSFAAVTSFDVIEHVQSPERCLREVWRVLRPGGKAVLTVVNRFAARDPHYHLWGVNFLPRELGDAYARLRGRNRGARGAGGQTLSRMHYYRFSAFVRAAERAGFRVREPRLGRKQRWFGAAWTFILERRVTTAACR